MKTAPFVVAAALAAVTAVAQPPGPPGGPGRRGPGPGFGGPDRLAEALQLTDAQKQSWKEIHEQHFADTKALFEKGRALHEALRAALDEKTPDPGKVGQAAIAVDQHRRQMEAAHKALEEKLAATLDDTQKTRFEALRAMRSPESHGPRGFGPHGPGFGPPPGDGPEHQE